MSLTGGHKEQKEHEDGLRANERLDSYQQNRNRLTLVYLPISAWVKQQRWRDMLSDGA